MSFSPTTAAARAVTGREAGDAERAHYDMVSVRIDIAMHIQALRRVQRQRQVQEAATPQVAETTGPPVSQRVRGGRQTAREDVIDDVDANPEIMSKAPSTPPAAAPPSEEAAENESFEATRAVKKKWQKLFALAEKLGRRRRSRRGWARCPCSTSARAWRSWRRRARTSASPPRAPR
jgi:hypothetical protein